jgi:hypothetical protein
MPYLLKYRGLDVFCGTAREVDLLADQAEMRLSQKQWDSAATPTDESNWPDEAQAAALLGTSIKTVIRYAWQGKIEVKKRARVGRKPMNIFNPRDLRKLKCGTSSIIQ